MSAAPSSVESRLEVLECHFTWDLDPSRANFLRLRDKLMDIGTEEGNMWLGHIYNLQGYIHHQLGLVQEALQFFTRAAETFHQIRTSNSDEGPWLVVNYGNLAWLYHHLGDQAQSESYLSKVDALKTKHPSPSQDQLHPEVGAEKAWTLMKFSKDKKLLAVDLFQEAIKIQPDRVEWCTSQVLALVSAHKHSDTALDDEILDKMKMAKERDPENLYLAVQCLEQCAKKGEDMKDEARELAAKILVNPVGSYNGMKAILRLYRRSVSVDEAMDLAEEALLQHPDNRYLKRCAALCYKWKIVFYRDSTVNETMLDRAVSLLKEVIHLYPDSCLLKELDLANIYAKSNHSLPKAEEIYKNLLQRDLEPADRQLLYNQYGKYLKCDRQDSHRAREYQKKAAEISHESFYRQNSIKDLEQFKRGSWNTVCEEIGLSPMESRLEVLECHFTWDLDPNRSKLFRLRDQLMDIGTEEGNMWLGHIYNLQGYIHHQLGLVQEALQFFTRAAETFHQIRTSDSDEGPWLVVNYGNLAWLYHHLGDQAQSESYLSKVDALRTKHPSPSQDQLHPEVSAEKAWTLMKSNKIRKLLAVELFGKAIKIQPDRVEWCTSQVLALVSAHKHSDTALDDEILDKMKMAKEQDPENLYLAVRYLSRRADKEEDVKDEARKLAAKILVNPVSSYNGMKAILRLYRRIMSDDEAMDLAEEALLQHPDNRYLKRCAALCYKWKIASHRDGAVNQSTIDRAVSLLKEVIHLYPDSCLVKELDLAYVYAKSNHSLPEAEEIYKNLLQRDLEPADRQMLYSRYANYLHFDRQHYNKSLRYHMKAAEIPHESFHRTNSIRILENTRRRGRNRMCGEIGVFLENLEESSQPPSAGYQ
ncbi:interferon-induced protein with tetratricopeptide repeats 2-like isoform X1 [Sphaeramia orbicularis]|uniref:Interferon-induced protein with tetratricopeptide repeats 2-like n=1 Tax=Sphaeramia orbicularis TaxID=375764 RepID=A0A673CLN9_9TELE|nr:interferon-induced protein with tetratricopeptide repeats 2-like isoform X1 [Sphaeramia orbicularis]XP_029988241.1 interferon-induced protein with tetratricopeptide repeats 2-like isoform X1 [Sphaeramia orbicularis]